MRRAAAIMLLVLTGCALPYYLDNGCTVYGNIFTGEMHGDCPPGEAMVLYFGEDDRIVGVQSAPIYRPWEKAPAVTAPLTE